MTQEEKDLVIKDLYARLAYSGVQIHVSYEDGFKYDKTLTYEDVKNYSQLPACSTTTVKPYLRSISSMSKEERDEYKKMLCDVGFTEFYKTADKILDFLYKNHFDVHGLIPLGLAIKALEGDMNKTEQTNTMRYIDKLICDVERVLMGLGYKVFTELNAGSKLWCIELLNASSSEEMPIRHKSMIRGLVKGYLHSFDYFGGTQKIYIYDKCKGLHPEDGRYSTLEYAMSRVSDNHKNDLFINYGTHTERYVIDNNDKQTVNIAISNERE